MNEHNENLMAKIVGGGGIFFELQDTGNLASWYKQLLGVPVERFGWFIDPEGQQGRTLGVQKGLTDPCLQIV